MTARLATTTDFAFVEELLTFGDGYVPQPGDVVDQDGLATTGGQPVPNGSVTVVASTEDTVSLRDAEGGEHEVAASSWLYVTESPTISGVWDKHLRRDDPDGVAYADDIVDPALAKRLRADVRRLLEEPADYHPGSGTKVRDLVHPSLFPYIEDRSVLSTPVDSPAHEPDTHDRFGRPFERSRYQWLPTPFAVAEDGTVRALSYINNLDGERHPDTVQDLSVLLATALPLIESVVGYVEATSFWREGELDDESELPELDEPVRTKAPPVSLRGRELLVIPKIVEYRLGAGETHEGVWHVEGMSHEHIVATCLYVLDRDEALIGGRLQFKRPYTVEEAGRLFWSADQGRPPPVGVLVDEGTIPLGGVETPAGRLLVFPNSHIHKLNTLSLAPGATEGRRRIIVFWIVDPNVTIPSTREVAPQQGVIPREEALAARLELMDERRRHKQTLNVRVVNLCEH